MCWSWLDLKTGGISGGRLVALVVAAVCTLALPAVSRAQYFPAMPPTKCAEVHGSEITLRRHAALASDTYLKAHGYRIEYYFRADATRYRVLSYTPEAYQLHPQQYLAKHGGSTSSLTSGRLKEQRIVSRRRTWSATDYMHGGLPINVGIGKSAGKDGGKDGEWAAVLSFTINSDGAVHTLDIRSCAEEQLLRLYTLDLTRDGLLDLVCATSAGVSGGGAVDLIELLPDGRFRDLWHDPKAAGARKGGYPPWILSSLRSGYALCTLHDYNGNGVWEIETRQYISYEGAEGTYTYNMLHTYSWRSHKWYPCTSSYPRRFAGQQRFYAAVLYAMTKLHFDDKHNEGAGNAEVPYSWKYRGRRYRVDYMPVDSVDGIRRLLGHWDDYPQGL